ncbi:MAG: twin-arginine translocase TatA/TatE family subunit [Arsenophonus sp.]
METTIAMATFGSPSQLFIIGLLVILIFGTKKLRSLGSDLGESLKNFKKAINDDQNKVDNNNNAEKHYTDLDFEAKNITEEMLMSSQEKKTTENKK